MFYKRLLMECEMIFVYFHLILYFVRPYQAQANHKNDRASDCVSH